MIEGPHIEGHFDVVEIVVSDHAAALGRVAPVVQCAVILDVHAHMMHVAVLHSLVIAQHEDGHRGGLIEFASRYPVPEAAHHHSDPVLHLDPVEVMDTASFDIIVAADDVHTVSSGQFDGSGS